MKYLSLIRFFNYRNLNDQEIKLSNSINVFIGQNGSGKTNILEGISLLNPGRGFRKNKLNQITNFKKNNPWVIFFHYNIKDLETNLSITYDINTAGLAKKKLLINNENKNQLVEKEKIPTVIWFIPEMERLFQGPPSLRRNFIDRLVYGFDKTILNLINTYSKLMKERTNIIQSESIDETWLNSIEEKIVDSGIKITKKRHHAIELLNKTFKEISLSKKNLRVCQLSLLGEIDKKIIENEASESQIYYLKALKESRKEDKFRGGCSIGPHKSDLESIYQNNGISAKFCSTGQQKEIILSILLCQCYCLVNKFDTTPIILLDEICSHLDNNTRSILLDICQWLKIQVLMTGTEKKLFSFLSIKTRYFNVNKGNISIKDYND